MNYKNKLNIFFIFSLILILFSTTVFASYEITTKISNDLTSISNKAGLLRTIRIFLIIFSAFFLILVLIQLPRLGSSRTLQLILIISILGLFANFYIGNSYFSTESIASLYSSFTSSDFCYLYQGELLTFRFKQNNQNVILICQKGKLENNRIEKSIHSILEVILEDYELEPLLHSELLFSTTTSDYIVFETNPEKTNFEKSILDDTYEFIRITLNENALNPNQNLTQVVE